MARRRTVRVKGKPTAADMRRNPALRPDSMLTPSQLANRKRIQQRRRDDRNPLYNPGATLAGSSLANAARQITDYEFKPAENQIRENVANATTQGTALQGRAKDYYAQLAAQEQKGVQTQAALGQMVQSQQGAVGNQAASALAAATSAEQQRLGTDASVRGAGLQGEGAIPDLAALSGLSAANQQNAMNQTAQNSGVWGNFQHAAGRSRASSATVC
jgi:hypothetical protein